jgi:hypothetical protein
MRWQSNLLSLLKKRENKSIALAIDTSELPVRPILMNNIIKLFQEVRPDTMLIQADFQIRDISPITKSQMQYFKHGKSSYTLVLEWAEQNVDTIFYITDVTGYIYEELTFTKEVFWLIPDDYLPRVPFGKAIKVA